MNETIELTWWQLVLVTFVASINTELAGWAIHHFWP